MRLFVPLVVVACTAFAAPVDSVDAQLLNTNASSEAPLCAYVRMEEYAWWSVGLQATGVCELIWKNETPVIYRVDRAQCGCGFFLTEEDCKGKGDMVLHRGPNFEESHFTEQEKPTWVLCQEIQG